MIGGNWAGDRPSTRRNPLFMIAVASLWLFGFLQPIKTAVDAPLFVHQVELAGVIGKKGCKTQCHELIHGILSWSMPALLCPPLRRNST